MNSESTTSTDSTHSIDSTDSTDRSLLTAPVGARATAGETLQEPLPHPRTSLAARKRLVSPAHVRLLSGVCLVFYLGQGLAGTGALLYLAGPVHLSVGAVGGCMTAAGALGLLAAFPAGRVSDRFGPKYVLVVALAAIAVAAFGFLAVRTVSEALGVACLYSAACQSAYVARGALAAFVAPDDPARLNAALYRAGNVGYALATPIVGGAVARGNATAYRLVLLGSAVAFALAAVGCVLVRARRSVVGSESGSESGSGSGSVGVAAAAAHEQRRQAKPSHDPRFLALTALYAVTSLQFMITEFALPLWVVDHTRAPRAMVGAAALVSTIVVVAVQPAASRRVSTTGRAVWAMAASGIAAGGGCLALAASGGRQPASAAVLVLVGALTLAVAEVVQVVGAITLSYRLAPVSAIGAYQGVFSLGQGVAMAAGPVVLARTVLRPGAGWPGVALLLAVAGLLVPAVVGTGRNRHIRPVHQPQPTDSGGQ